MPRKQIPEIRFLNNWAEIEEKKTPQNVGHLTNVIMLWQQSGTQHATWEKKNARTQVYNESAD